MPATGHFALVVGVLFAAITPTLALEPQPETSLAARFAPTETAGLGAVPPPGTPAMASPFVCCPDALTTRCPGDPPHWWASADYTFGWIRGVAVQPLLTATPAAGGTPTVLFGDKQFDGGFRSGFQLRGGLWLDEYGTVGLEAGMLFLGGLAERGQGGDLIRARSLGGVLQRRDAPDFQIVSSLGAVAGRASIDVTSSDFWGAEAAFRKLICCDCRGRLDCLVGYRFLSYGDTVRVTEIVAERHRVPARYSNRRG